MLITRLRLAGFKSFVEPAEVMIEPGLTGVVGPNGCGKSNLLEALRWVMGETSYKSMRASAMDDVIFAGTSARPARNMAEVTVVIDNTDRKAPAEFNDEDTLEITRRIEREAGSAYRINGKDVRAKDVRILFEDAATGTRSPALVRQGQIGQIVNARPEQRRRILEDAAGIAGLHSRRHDAELRLKAAEANLARLGDITGAMASQIDQLKRQARQARRYHEISEAIRRCEAAVLYVSWRMAAERVDADENELRGIEAQLLQATEAEAAAVLADAARAEALEPLRRKETEAAAAVAHLKHEADATEREQAATRARLAELHRQIERHQADLARERERAGEARDIVARQDEGAEEIARLQDGLTSRLEGLAETVTRQGEAVETLEMHLADVRRELAQRQAERHAQAARRADLTEQIARLDDICASLDRERDALDGAGPDAATLTRVTRDLDGAREKLELAAAAVVETDAAWRDREAAAERASGAAREASLKLSSVQTEADALSRVLAIVASGDTGHPLLDDVAVAPGLERALGAALGEDLDAPLQEHGATAHWQATPPRGPGGDPALPDGVLPLAGHVDAPAALARRLAQTGLVDQDQGAALQDRLATGQRLVSRKGDLWRWDGLTIPASAPSPAAVRLAQRNRLTELRTETRVAETAAATAEADLGVAEDQLAAARLRRDDAVQDRDAAVADVATREKDLADAERLREAHNAKHAALEDRRSRTDAEKAAAMARLDDAERALAELAPTDDLTKDLESLEARVKAERETLGEARTELSLAEREQKALEDQARGAKDEADRWGARYAEAQRQSERLEADIATAKAETGTLSDQPQALENKLSTLRNEADKAEANRMDCADAIARATTAATVAAQDLRKAQVAVFELRETKARAETRRDAARADRADAAERIASSLDVAPMECAAVGGLDPDVPLPDIASLEAKLAKLSGDRERLGGVNLAADEELARLEGEHDKLAQEAQDVEEAVRKLRGAIGRLNGEARKRLTAAFDNVNARFSDLFQTLFDGGEARLELVASEDPLESGLEIIAKPPGKKPATLSLLSGGEQALTALSLIFAVFLTNPSPICVLDEVDAPLDDANVDRFCALMDTMTERTDTRFLVITHHPMTMSRMHRLYGVTMVERGISQLVSVDLVGAERFLEAG